MTPSTSTQLTTAGVAFRDDRGLGGLLCFNPHPGILYAVSHPDAGDVKLWLKGESPLPRDIYSATLGLGWSTKKLEPRFPSPQLLPSAAHWPTVPSPEWPLIINWFITGRCPLACRYCYAEDLMRDDSIEPGPKQIGQIAESILKLNPVVVVITGGDPLFTPNLTHAIQHLSGRVGLIVDTSGFTLRDDHLRLFKEHNVSLRISIDSQVPAIHDLQRPVSSLYPKLRERGSTLAAAVEALSKALDAGIGVTVQTVATKKSANYLVSLGDVLYRLGVRSWRIFKVAPSLSSMGGYRALVGTHMDDGRPHKGKRQHGPYDHAFAAVLKARTASWNDSMAIQVTMNEVPNSVVLVAPDGSFVTESNTGRGKVVLDTKSPRSPSRASVHKMVNMSSHAARYLNLTSAKTMVTCKAAEEQDEYEN